MQPLKFSDNTDRIIHFKDPSLEKAIRNKIKKPQGNIFKQDVLDIK